MAEIQDTDLFLVDRDSESFKVTFQELKESSRLDPQVLDFSSDTSGDNQTEFTLPIPEGTVAGCLLVATLTSRSDVTVPTGWTSNGTFLTNLASNQRITILTKTATDSEPESITFTQAEDTRFCGQLFATIGGVIETVTEFYGPIGSADDDNEVKDILTVDQRLNLLVASWTWSTSTSIQEWNFSAGIKAGENQIASRTGASILSWATGQSAALVDFEHESFSTGQTDYQATGVINIIINSANMVSSVNGQTGAVSLGVEDLNNVSDETPTTGQVLTWEGSEWSPADLPAGVTQIIAGNNISISPENGTGAVTISAGSMVTGAGSYSDPVVGGSVSSVNGMTGEVEIGVPQLYDFKYGENLNAPQWRFRTDLVPTPQGDVVVGQGEAAISTPFYVDLTVNKIDANGNDRSGELNQIKEGDVLTFYFGWDTDTPTAIQKTVDRVWGEEDWDNDGVLDGQWSFRVNSSEQGWANNQLVDITGGPPGGDPVLSPNPTPRPLRDRDILMYNSVDKWHPVTALPVRRTVQVTAFDVPGNGSSDLDVRGLGAAGMFITARIVEPNASFKVFASSQARYDDGQDYIEYFGENTGVLLEFDTAGTEGNIAITPAKNYYTQMNSAGINQLYFKVFNNEGEARNITIIVTGLVFEDASSYDPYAS